MRCGDGLAPLPLPVGSAAQGGRGDAGEGGGGPQRAAFYRGRLQTTPHLRAAPPHRTLRGAPPRRQGRWVPQVRNLPWSITLTSFFYYCRAFC